MLVSTVLVAAYQHPKLPQALPPKVQQEKEMNAIKNDPRLVELIGDRQVLEIRRVNHDHYHSYDVIGKDFTLRVDVFYLPSDPHICGPAKFELFFYLPEFSIF